MTTDDDNGLTQHCSIKRKSYSQMINVAQSLTELFVTDDGSVVPLSTAVDEPPPTLDSDDPEGYEKKKEKIKLHY